MNMIWLLRAYLREIHADPWKIFWLGSFKGQFMVYRVTGLGPGLPDYRVTGLRLP